MIATHHPSTAAPTVFAMTMVRDEAAMLPRWLDHYGRQLGYEHLLVIDDSSSDGSTDNLPCPVLRLPAEGWKPSWSQGRRRLVSSMARGMLACYDVVIFTDVDEFLVADPERYSGLLDYLRLNADEVIAPVAVNVLHDESTEPALDPGRPVLDQRHLVKFVPVMCKPVIKRVAADWIPGFHGIMTRFKVHPDLMLVHLKYHDAAEVRQVARARHELHNDLGRGGKNSAWSQDADALTAKMLKWTQPAHRTPPPELDPYGLDVAGLVRRKEGARYYHVTGNQLGYMAKQPLYSLPPRFRVL